MIEPLRLSLDLRCPADHAFTVWTSRIDTWWPADHTVTGTDDVTVVLEPRLGGRIYEHAVDGRRHEWGWITVWEPPTRLAYRWHLRRDAADATDVEIRFVGRADGTTRLEITHTGWERLGAGGADWRERNRGGWDSLLPHYREEIDCDG